jgi:type I restriction enzyme, S subunit
MILFTKDKLSNLCDIIIGRTPSRGEKKFWGKGNIWVSISDMKQKLVSSTKEEITDLGRDASRSRLIRKGTLLMSFKLSIGKLSFAGADLYTNEAIAALPVIDNSKINKEYLFYILQFIPLLGGNQAAMGKTLNKESLSKIIIPYPTDLKDQKRIVKIFTECELLIQNRKESIGLLNKFVNSTFLEMFGNSKNFEFKTIEEIASPEKYSLSSGPFGSNLTSKHYVKEGVLVLRGKNISSGKIDLSDVVFVSETTAHELRRSELKPDDIVIVAVGSSGLALKIPQSIPRAIMSQNFNKITPNKDLILPTYLEFSINSEIVQHQFRRVMTDGGRTFLSLTKIKEIKIPLPDISLQKKFISISEKVDSLINQFQESLKELENLYGSISQSAFKGELDLNKIEISDMEEKELPKPEIEPVGEPYLVGKATLQDTIVHIDDLIRNNFPEEAFSFKQLENVIAETGVYVTYENIKSFLFTSLEGKSPLLEQLFDDLTKEMVFKIKT